jgi:AcrR family transcriptional regulator
MTGTPRERARAQTLADITRIGREQLAKHGAGALSLRAVARELGVVSSAIYRYVKNRDELLTLLIVDGYTELGDEVDAAVAAAPTDPAEQFRVIGRTVRNWGLREPARYALLFGSPVPGYHAPAGETSGPGTRVIAALIPIFATLAGSAPPVPPSLAANFADIRAEFGTDTTDAAIARGVLVWASLFGTISFDIFDQYGRDTFTSRDDLFELHLDGLLTLLRT